MKIKNVNPDDLSDGVYYYCANCERWFGQSQPTLNHQCPDCGQRWKNARGILTKKSSAITKASSPSKNYGARLLLVLVVLVGGYCVIRPTVSSAWRQFKIVWSNFVEGIVLLLQFIGSILLSFVALAIATSLLFYLLRKLIYFLILLLLAFAAFLSKDKYRPPPRYQANRTLEEHSFLVGTLTNLVSSLCALLIVSWIFQRPSDYWDFGIQFLIALIIQIVIFRTSL